MERTAEFRELAGVSAAETVPPQQEKRFYVTFNDKIASMGTRLARAPSYRAVLSAESELVSIQQDMDSIMGTIRIEGTQDQQTHFEGIKQILAQRLAATGRLFQEKKRALSMAESDVAPERPTAFRQTPTNTLLERENQAITQSTEYDVARKRIQKIESVQKAITENLMLQDERIDSICDTTGHTTEVYKELESEEDFDGGSFLRRALFIVLICLSFVLLFMNWFYR